MAGRSKPSARARAIPLIARGDSDAQVAKEVGCAESTVARWREQETGRAAAKSLPAASVEAIAQGVAEILTPAASPADPLDDTLALDVPADLGPSIQRLIYRGILAQERILETVTKPEYILIQPAADVSDLVRTLANGTARFFEAGERVLVAQKELERIRLEAEKQKAGASAMVKR